MDRIAVVGDHDSIYGFAALGLDIYSCTEDDVRGVLLNLASQDYGIIYLTERMAAVVPTVIEHFKAELAPAIILIPGTSGNTGEGISSVRRSVEQAVGSDILFSNN